ncbi:SH3 domain-containing protein [Neisseria animalis]|nr:SH3 domain-containing protein [Neisseria animalis]VEE06597.1 Uncharacterised protein [Neisseria animalis]
MKIIKIFLLCLSLTFSTSAFAVCYVSDPTGTPLNVRAKPAGKVIAKLKNGTPVVLIDHVAYYDRKGKAWIQIATPDNKKIGYVFDDYIVCNFDDVW